MWKFKQISFLLNSILFLGILTNCTNMSNLKPQDDKMLIEMVLIEGGIFEMGDCWDYQDEDALPTHLVKVDSFYLSKYEITVGQYERYAQLAGIDYEALNQRNYPATNINWDEANAFCEWYGFRLPTEAEWEYAARSGGKQERYAGTDAIGDEVDQYIVHLANSGEHPHPVGTKQPNGLELYDMSGNVYEWIGNYYAKYGNDENNKHTDLTTTQMRIIRGGCFSTFPIRNYERVALFSDQRSPRIGFRCVKSVK